MTVRPLKILHIFGRMQRGGAEMRTLDIMRNIDRQVFHLDFCSLSGQSGALDEEIRLMDGNVHLVKLGKFFPLQFVSLLRKQKYDIIHSHVHYFSGFILLLAAIAKVPIRIAHFRSSGDGQKNSFRQVVQRRIMRSWINRFATHILAVSKEAMNAAWGPKWQDDNRCQYIYNGLDMSFFQQLASLEEIRREFDISLDDKVCIHVGNMRPEKNHRKILEVFTEMEKRDKSVKLLMVGRGDVEIEAWIKYEVTKSGLADKVILLGERTDVPRLLKAADVMIFPSLREGLPGAVLEAAAVGTPVLASDLPVINEIMEQLPLLRSMSTDEENTKWAMTALSLCRDQVGDEVRLTATREFLSGPFTIHACVRQVCSIWTGDTV